MRVVRVRTGVRVEPWDDPVGDVRVLGVPLRERQERIAAACGLRFDGEADAEEAAEGGGRRGGAGGPDTLWWDDDLDVSASALRGFLKASASGGRLALVERPPRPGDLEVEPRGPDWRGEPTRLYGLRRGPVEEPVVVEPRGIAGVARPPGPFRRDVPYFLTARYAVTVRHWVHLLRAGVSGISSEIDARLIRAPWNILWTWAREPLRAGGGRIAAVGRRCKIHPTARLEGCVLGDDVEIGAFSVLRGCVVGDRARIEDHVTAKGSVVEPDGHLGNYSMFNLSVLGAGSSISHIGAQATILGRETFVATFATMQDLNLSGNVRVRWAGRLVDSGGPFLGCAVGHRVRMGAGVMVVAGRAIPNDVTLVGPPGMTIGKVPEGARGGVWTVRDGEMVPTGRSPPGSPG